MMERRIFLARTGQLTALAGVAPVLAGCNPISLLAGETADLYTLTPPRDFADAGPPADWQLLVEEPTAASGLDSRRIALRPSPNALDFYANRSWVARMPAMLQGMLVETFENSGRVPAVGRDTLGLRANYVLRTEVRDFQAEYTDPSLNSPPTVRVRLNVRVVDIAGREIYSARTFEASQPSTGTTFASIIMAFEAATGEVLADIVNWMIDQELPVSDRGRAS